MSVRCPIPLVLKIVKRAREMGGIEERWPYASDPHQTWPTERRGMHFRFANTDNGHAFFDEASGWVSQWENENEPEDAQTKTPL